MLELELRAGRYIAEGQEVTISYELVEKPHAYRQKLLTRKFKFTCTCETCSLPPSLLAESDARRARIEKLLQTHFYAEAKVSVPLEIFEEGLEWAAKEGLFSDYAHVARCGAEMAVKHYDRETARKWIKKVKEAPAVFGKKEEGEEAED